MPQRQLISARRKRWLDRELAQWRAEQLVDDAAAAAIGGRYEASSRARVARIALLLGATMLGIGTIWLVASNLEIDEAGPLVRVAFVAGVWLALVALAEAARGRERFGALAGPLALLAALAYGATVFQVAQSLQVPAYEPWLLAAWAGGALAYAYATASAGALVVGLAAATGCYVWLLAREVDGGASFVLGLAIAAPLATAGAVLHREGTPREPFAAAWRLVAALVALLALGAAALPALLEDEALPELALPVAGAALVLAAVVAVRADRLGRIELAGALAVVGAAVALVLLAPDVVTEPFSGEQPAPGQLTHTLVASAAFLALAVGIVFLGVAHASAALTNLAIAAIVLFVAVQSFGLIAPLFSGALLVLAVGAILLVCGLLADRGRRALLREVAS